jgi:hypothetical protein
VGCTRGPHPWLLQNLLPLAPQCHAYLLGHQAQQPLGALVQARSISRLVSGSEAWRSIDRIMRDIWPLLDQSGAAETPSALIVSTLFGVESEASRLGSLGLGASCGGFVGPRRTALHKAADKECVHEPNQSRPRMYQPRPTASAPMTAPTAIATDRNASLRMPIPGTVAGQQPGPAFLDCYLMP